MPVGHAVTGHAVTGNRLRDGAVVYRTRLGAWSTRVAEAGILSAAADAERLAAEAARATGPDSVVGPYVIAVETGAGTVRPASLRERIRASGPTVPEIGAAAPPARSAL